MGSIRASTPVVRVLAGIAVLFGIATLFSGGSALFELHGKENHTAQIVPFVLYFNFAAGFAYVVTGAGLMKTWVGALICGDCCSNHYSISCFRWLDIGGKRLRNANRRRHKSTNGVLAEFSNNFIS